MEVVNKLCRTPLRNGGSCFRSYLRNFMGRDPWPGQIRVPSTLHGYSYVSNNPTRFVDYSGLCETNPYNPEFNLDCIRLARKLQGLDQDRLMPFDFLSWGYDDLQSFYESQILPYQCPIGDWDCEAVLNVYSLRDAFIGSAWRHNRIPGMNNNAFAALVASVIVSERRIGRIPTWGEDWTRSRTAQSFENFLVGIGCNVSGHLVLDALLQGDLATVKSYINNEQIPPGNPLTTRPSVGIGNVKLPTAENVLAGQACDANGVCLSTPIAPLRLNNGSAISDPFDLYGSGSEEAYTMLGQQLLNDEINIEYVAANLEIGALRLMSLGLTPTAMDLALWHLKGIQTFSEAGGDFNTYGAAWWITSQIPTALNVLEINSTWSWEEDYAAWLSR